MGNTTIIYFYFFYIYNFFQSIFKIYTTGGASPPHLGGRKEKERNMGENPYWLMFLITKSLVWLDPELIGSWGSGVGLPLKDWVRNWSGIATHRIMKW